MSLLKIPLLLATASGITVGFTPPRPPPKEDERKTYEKAANGEALPTVGSYGLVPFKVITYAVVSLETYLILCGESLSQTPHTSWAANLAPGGLSGVSQLQVTPTVAVGTFLVCAGAYLRRECYQRLGRQFTFELSIQRDHQLVTDGPYAFVRHPGYTALVTQAVGLVLCIAGPGSWWREMAAGTILGNVLGAIVGLLIAVCLVCGIDRTYKEDAMLRELFKEQWVYWARRTRYRMIPYLF